MSLGYVLIYFNTGTLPWKKFGGFMQLVGWMKRTTSFEKLCRGCPVEFEMFLNYCKGLRFDEDPDYDYLRKLFQNLMHKNKLEYDWKFDWIILK